MVWHSWAGYSLLVAVVTRLLWGLVGSQHARFASFLRSPQAVLDYLKGKPYVGVGHNPLGGWATVALLLAVFAQGLSGLFSNDDIAFEGPFAYWAGDLSGWFTELHEVNWGILQVLIVIHLLAIGFYRVVKKQNLLTPMLRGHSQQRFSETPPRHPVLALLIASVVAAALYGLITLAPSAPSYY